MPLRRCDGLSAPTPDSRCPPSLSWLVASIAAMVAFHTLASVSTMQTIDLMASPSAFAREVRAFELIWLPYFRVAIYVIVAAFVLWYLRPLIAYFRARCPADPSPAVERVALGFPLVAAVAGMAGWAAGAVLFPAATIVRFGTWSPELASQEVISPLVNGFLATTTTFLVVDWIVRSRVIPHVFPGGGAADVRGAMTLSVRGRILVFLLAVAFIPMFTMLGLARTTLARYSAGLDLGDVVASMATGSLWVFVLYTALGIALTLVLARTLTEPIGDVARALARIRDGDLDVAVAVESADELGRLQEGVNSMAAALRDRARILTAFGRVVEPAVRDRLLAGGIGVAGDLRFASILFVDLRGFTAMAERETPSETVETLNDFFTTISAWVRECGGFVDKFIGDAALVVFGLFDDEDGASARGASAAMRCGLGLCARLEGLNDARRKQDREPLGVSMAIHSGDVLAGTIGAADRHEFTVIGDTVNVAARLQQIAKDTDAMLVVSSVTRDLAATGGADVVAARRETIVLRGRREPIDYVTIPAEPPVRDSAQPNVRD
jgi:adenylate cyclase